MAEGGTTTLNCARFDAVPADRLRDGYGLEAFDDRAIDGSSSSGDGPSTESTPLRASRAQLRRRHGHTTNRPVPSVSRVAWRSWACSYASGPISGVLRREVDVADHAWSIAEIVALLD